MSDQIDQNGSMASSYGQGTVSMVNNLYARGINRISLLMRHSAREYNPDIHDLLNPLTDEGRGLCAEFGSALRKDIVIRGYASPPDRCVETCQIVVQSHDSEAGQSESVRSLEGLGVFYGIDQVKMWKGMKAAGGLSDYVADWLAGEVPEDAMLAPDYAATTILRLLKGKLDAAAEHSKQLDVCVSHDMSVLFLRDFFGLESVDVLPIQYLDGLALYREDGRLKLESHHGSVSEIDLPSYRLS